MSTEYQYSISGDFTPAGVDIAQLQEEIEADMTITVPVDYIYTEGDALYVVFPSALAPMEKASLDTVIANHIPNNIFNTSIIQSGYIQLNSTLADNQAIRIYASDTNGGIDIDAGFGGIMMTTSNGMSLNAAAASNFTTTGGNLTLEATTGLVNIDAGSGINLGNDSITTPILIGSTDFVKNITMGNMTGASTSSIRGGTGGVIIDTTGPISLDSANASSNFTHSTNANGQDLMIALTGNTDSSLIMQSSGTGSDALALYTTQGNMQMITFGTSNTISIATAFAGSGSITLGSGVGGSGGLVFESGSNGIAINAYNGGIIGVGHFSGGDVLLGTAAVARTVTIGNNTTITTTNLISGTGGINLDSTGTISLDANAAASNFSIATTGNGQDLTLAITGNTDSSLLLQSSGTGSDAIALTTTQGNMQITGSGTTSAISIATAFAGSGSISLSSGAGGSGGLTFESGSSGIAINAYNGGAIGIGHFNGGDMFIGSAAAARTITFGNNTGATRIFERWGTGGLIKHQDTHTSLSDADASLTTAQLITQILTIGPTTDRTLTLPNAATIVTDISGIQVNDCIDFTIIHTTTSASDPFITVAMGTGGTAVGFMDLHPRSNNASTYFSSGSATFRLRMTNVTVSSEAYSVYRIS